METSENTPTGRWLSEEEVANEMARSKREIAVIKRLVRYLAAALNAKLMPIWNWPERWSEWKEIGRVIVGEGKESIHFDEKYLGDDYQMKVVMWVPAKFTDVDATISIGFNEEPDDALASANYQFDFSDTEGRKKNSPVGFEAILYGRKMME